MALARSAAAADVRKALARRVTALYRKMCREVPVIRATYVIEETPAELRHMILLQFRKNKDATDPRIIDMLLTKGEMELEEAANQWKQRGHIMALLKPELESPDPLLDFEEHMRRFNDGTLEMEMLTKDYDEKELAKAARQLEAAIASGAKDPEYLPGASASLGKLPWARRADDERAALAAAAAEAKLA